VTKERFERNRLLIYLFVLVFSWTAITLLLDQLMGEVYALLWVPISEYYPFSGFTAYLSVGRLWGFLLLGLVGTVILYLIFREIITQPPETEEAKKTQILAEVVFMVFIFFFLSGLGMRYAANELHAYTSLLPLVYPYTPFTITPPSFTNNLVYLVYLYDEVIGHKFIYLGIIGFIVAVTILQNQHRYQRRFTRRDYTLLGLLGFLFGLGLGVSIIEGQAGFETLIFSSIALIAMVTLLATRRIRFTETINGTVKSNPFFAFSLLFFLGTILAIIGCGIYYGMMPVYPFFIQPSQKALIDREILRYILSAL